MNYLTRMAFVFMALTLPAVAISDDSAEERELVCDKSVYYSEELYISISDVHERIVSLSWPDIPPIARLARMSVNAVFQIKVSPSGEVCSIESIGGSPIFIPPLTTEIKKWKFRPNRPFCGIIAIRYVSSRGFRLL